MEMRFSRRAFLGGAAAMAVWPSDVWGVVGKHGADASSSVSSIWEHPDGTATDSVMVRRLYLDLAGRIPTVDEAKEYVRSDSPDKREALVARLVASPEFSDLWAMRFCDILRVKSEFPINLWPNAVYVYHERIRSFVENNESWEHFGRALLVSQGSNFRDAETNFFRATDKRNPNGWAEAVAQTFFGIAPFDLTAAMRKELAGYFANLRLKKTREWKEEIVFSEGEDMRVGLCDRIFLAGRQAVADSFAMRVKEWIFGPQARRNPVKGAKICGIKDAVKSVLLSPEYARGSITGGFPARRLEAEILDDVFCALSGSKRDYQSPAPEPFTFLPPRRHTVCIEDGSVSSGFLSLFGRPARDTGLMDERRGDVTSKQRLYLFNSGSVHRKLGGAAIPRWRMPDGSVNPFYKRPVAKRIDYLYWKFLSRPPSRREHKAIADLWNKRSNGGKNRKADHGEMMRDVAWCIINSKEFLYRT